MTALTATSGLALRPVMDLSDGRVVAYDAIARTRAGRLDDLGALESALAEAAAIASAPVLVHPAPRLLDDPAFEPVALAEAAGCSTTEAVFMLPSAAPGDHELRAACGRCAERLHAAGFPVGLAGVDPLGVSWPDVVGLRPVFLLMDPLRRDLLDDEAAKAALVGLLAFCGRLGARLIAQGVAGAADAKELRELGIFYGSGDHLHRPVVLDPRLAQEGDVVVPRSWFHERVVRRLSRATDDAPARLLPAPARPAVVDDRRLAVLLTEWAGRLSRAGDVAEVQQALADMVPQLVAFDRLAVFEADWDRFLLRPRVLVGEVLAPLVEVAYHLNVGITGWVFQHKLPYLCGRTAEHPEAAPIPDQGETDESLLAVPLVSGDDRLGVLDVWRDGADQFCEGDLERVALLGRLAADAWRAARQRADLAERVMSDTTTGLLNKRWWYELAPREAAQARRARSTIAVLLVDLDGFKGVNDSLGHQSGDRVLKQVARLLTAAVRSGDAVIRFGGDEFVLLLRDCSAEGALEVADKIHLSLATTCWDERAGAVTASVGIAMFPEHGSSLEEVARHADGAMYRAKALGRDRTACFVP